MTNKLPDLEYGILRIASEYECADEIFWKAGDEDEGHVEFFVNCNDFFAWGCADAEEIDTMADVELWEKSIMDVGRVIFDNPLDEDGHAPKSAEWAARFNVEIGCLLYCARRRESRPQGAFYPSLDKRTWHLFDECGPVRPACMFNPKDRPES